MREGSRGLFELACRPSGSATRSATRAVPPAGAPSCSAIGDDLGRDALELRRRRRRQHDDERGKDSRRQREAAHGHLDSSRTLPLDARTPAPRVIACQRHHVGMSGTVSAAISMIARRSAGGQVRGAARAPAVVSAACSRRRIASRTSAGSAANAAPADQIAERIAEQPRRQVEVAQRPAATVGTAAGRERAREARDALDRFDQPRFMREQHVGDEVVEIGGQRRAGPGAGDACLPGDARDQVGHLRLVLEDHQGDDVAGRRQVGAQVDQADERRQVGPRFADQRRRIGRIRRDGVGPIGLLATPRGDLPAAPAVGERTGVVGDDRGVVAQRRAARPGHDRPDVEAGHAGGVRPVVTAAGTTASA